MQEIPWFPATIARYCPLPLITFRCTFRFAAGIRRRSGVRILHEFESLRRIHIDFEIKRPMDGREHVQFIA